MGEIRRTGIMAIWRELHDTFRTLEELEHIRQADHADDPEGLELRMRRKDDMQALIPAAQSQICDIQRANRRPCHHVVPNTLNPGLWSALPPDLTELVFSKLPMNHIIALPRSITTSSTFRRTVAQRQPNLLALMRWGSRDTVRATVYDPASDAWTGFDLKGFPASSGNHRDLGYEDSMYAHEKGLVCFVPPSPRPVLVTNPLTGEWRTLPNLEHKHTLAVQLLVEDSGVYKVKLVCGDSDVRKLHYWYGRHKPENKAFCYDSSTGRWESLDSGLVFGGCGSLQQFQRKIAVVFDCATRLFWYLAYQVTSQQQPYGWAGVRNSVVVLHDVCRVSELAWGGTSYCMPRTLTPAPHGHRTKAPHLVFLFATERYLFVVGDSNVKVHGRSCQLLQLFDRETSKWRLASDLGESDPQSQFLKRAFVCELRWDAVP